MSTTFAPAIGSGRHRAGRPGLLSVTALVPVRRRGWFLSLFRAPKHRLIERAVTPAPRRAPIHAV